jgi:hypothetical protein
VFNVTPRDVRHVAVGGRLLVRDGQFTTIDEHDELRRAIAACQTLFARAGLRGPAHYA